jgi:hypothetical protein
MKILYQIYVWIFPPVVVVAGLFDCWRSVLCFLFCQDFSFCVLYFISEVFFFVLCFMFMCHQIFFRALLCVPPSVAGVNVAHGMAHSNEMKCYVCLYTIQYTVAALCYVERSGTNK